MLVNSESLNENDLLNLFSSAPNYDLGSIDTWLMFASGQTPSNKEKPITNISISPIKPEDKIVNSTINSIVPESPTRSNLSSMIQRSQLNDSPDGVTLKEKLINVNVLMDKYLEMKQPECKEELAKRISATINHISSLIEQGEDIGQLLDVIHTVYIKATNLLKKDDYSHFLANVMKRYRKSKEEHIQKLKSMYNSPNKSMNNATSAKKKPKVEEIGTSIIMRKALGVGMRANSGNYTSHVKIPTKSTITYQSKTSNRKF